MSRATIVVVDDEELIRWSICEHLGGLGYTTIAAEDGAKGLEAIAQHAPDLVLTDLKMPNVDGMELLRQVSTAEGDLPVIVLTAHGAVDSAVEATKLGARAYLTKPFDLREVALRVEQVLDEARLSREVQYLRGRQKTQYGSIIGSSPAMQRLFGALHRLEEVEVSTVLVVGESGTGKDLVANAIHSSGPRSKGPMMEVDCASLPENLIESELFGHEKGAFTDARQTRRGLFELAKGGTVFLDEIGEMTLNTQSSLLRALENRRFRRVGGSTPITLDATVIAATNRDLTTEVAAQRFRQDLFYRLDVVRIEVPPLRDRRGDVPALVHHFVERFNTAYRKHVAGIAGDAMAALERYTWPGNVRELRNVIERVVILEADDEIRLEHLPAEVRLGSLRSGAAPFVLPEDGIDLEAVERSFLEQAMARTHDNQSAAARLLGISRYALRYRLEKFGLRDN